MTAVTATSRLDAPLSAWSNAIAAWATYLEPRPAETVALMLKRVRSFAKDHPRREPWSITADDVLAWTKSKGWGGPTLYSYRSALRAFYAWAADSGRIADCPVPTPRDLLRVPVPALWAVQIEAFCVYLLASRPTTTVKLRRWHLEQLARAHAEIDPWEITTEDLLEWMARSDWAAATRRSVRGTLRTFYRWAADVDRIETSPAGGLPSVVSPDPVPHPAPEDRIRLALDESDDRTSLMVLLGATCGLRRGEIAAVHTSDLVGDLLRVRGKGGRARLVPVPYSVAEAIQRTAPGWLFPAPSGDHLTPSYVGRLLSTALGEGVTGHGLRHRYGTVTYSATTDLFAVQRLLGHRRPETTAIYVAVPDEAIRKAARAAALSRFVDLT